MSYSAQSVSVYCLYKLAQIKHCPSSATQTSHHAHYRLAVPIMKILYESKKWCSRDRL